MSFAILVLSFTTFFCPIPLFIGSLKCYSIFGFGAKINVNTKKMITEMYRYAQDEPSLNLSLRLIRLHNELSEKYLKSQEKFTKRELEIIELIAQGLNSWEISDKLHISKHTVDTHRKNIYRKGNFTGIRDVVLFSLVYDMG